MSVCVSLSVHACVRASVRACIGAYMRSLFYMVVAVFFLLKKTALVDKSVKPTAKERKLEDLKGLKRSPDLNNVKNMSRSI